MNKSSELNKGIQAAKEGDYMLAMELLSLAIKKEESAEAYSERGWIYYIHRKGELAIYDFNRAIELDRNSDITFFRRGVLSFEIGHYTSAVKDFTKAVKINSEDPIYYSYLALSKAKLGYNSAALTYLDKSIELDPQTSTPYLLKAQIHGQKGEYANALANLINCLVIQPDHPTALRDKKAIVQMLNYGQRSHT